MTLKRHVIIGNGPAAVSAVKAIRSQADKDAIVLIARENYPACALPLTTYYLSGSISYGRLFLYNEDFYRKYNINFIGDKKAVAVKPGNATVLLNDGTEVTYDDLLLAAGASPVVPDIKGINSPGIFTLHSIQDAKTIFHSLKNAATVAVIGAGAAGIQTADALIKQVREVTIVEVSGHILTRLLDDKAAEILEKKMMADGIRLRLGQQVTQIDNIDGNKQLRLSSGEQIGADVIILNAGITPNIDLVKDSGINIRQGIIVDEYAKTSVENIYAAGDIAETIENASRNSVVNATWTNAVEMGTAAGLNMAGKKTPLRRNLRVNITSPFSLPIVSMGVVSGEKPKDEVVYTSHDFYRKMVFQDNRLIGAVLIGDVEDVGLIANLIEQREIFSSLKTHMRKKAFIPFARAFQLAVKYMS